MLENENAKKNRIESEMIRSNNSHTYKYTK